MQKLFFSLCLLFISSVAFGQDIVSLKDGRRIHCRILNKDSVNLNIEIIKNERNLKTMIPIGNVKSISYSTEIDQYEGPSLYHYSGLSATIYFVRNSDVSTWRTNPKIFVNQYEIADLENPSHFQLNVKPGNDRLRAVAFDTSFMDLKVDSGRKYYVMCKLNPNSREAAPYFEMADSASTDYLINSGSLKVASLNPRTPELEAGTGRFGIIFGGGIGYDKLDMGVTSNNKDITLSPGGGLFLGCDAGYLFSRNFEIGLTGYYQRSSLTPEVENGSATFSRYVFLATPSVIIPINKDKESSRFKLGIGPGYYSGALMKIRAAKVTNGFDADIQYKPAYGIHASLLFETFFSETGSIALGLRSYWVTYKHKNPAVFSLDGSGLDFIFGIHFHM